MEKCLEHIELMVIAALEADHHRKHVVSLGGVETGYTTRCKCVGQVWIKQPCKTPYSFDKSNRRLMYQDTEYRVCEPCYRRYLVWQKDPQAHLRPKQKPGRKKKQKTE